MNECMHQSINQSMSFTHPCPSVLYCTVPFRTVRYCNCTILYVASIVLSCNVRVHVVINCTVMYTHNNCTVLYRTVQDSAGQCRTVQLPESNAVRKDTDQFPNHNIPIGRRFDRLNPSLP